jgi:uncharacterized membrane protein (UPF0127 family)
VIRLLAAALLALALIARPALAQDAEPTRAQHLKPVPLTIATSRGKQSYTVEVAATPGQQEIGMMFRTSNPPRHGMIFPMAPPRMATFWMKNTLISLDLIFIRADGTISSIAPNAPTRSLGIIASFEPVAAVLELSAGAAKRDGLKPGDKVRW